MAQALLQYSSFCGFGCEVYEIKASYDKATFFEEEHGGIGGGVMSALSNLCLVKECRELEEYYSTSCTDTFNIGGSRGGELEEG